MNVYYRNFWSLHADFVHDFSTLRHKGFSLPLLITFHVITHHPDIKNLLKDPSFADGHTRCSIRKNSDIQPFFDRYIKRNVPLKRRKNGKIVLYMSLLRFPGSITNAYLSPENTIIVGAGLPQPNDGPNVIRFESFIRAGDPAWPAIRDKAHRLLDRHSRHPVYGHPFFREQFLESLRVAVGAVNGVVRLFEKHPVAAVVLGSTNEPIGRALAIMASRRRVPSVATQHGLIGNEQGFLPVFASRLAVHGLDEVQFYANRGVNREHVVVTGHPRFDSFRTDAPGNREGVLSRYKIHPKHKVVLVATNQIRDLEAWGVFISRLARYPGVTVLIKPHRNEVVNEQLSGYVALAKKFPNVKLLAGKSDRLRDLLPRVDAAVTELSTAGLEALIAGVPALFLRKPSYEGINHRYYYDKMDEFVSTDPEYLARLTHAVLKQPSVRKRNLEKSRQFLAHAYPVKLSGEALARLLSRLTGKPDRRPVARKYEGMLVKGSGPKIYYVRGLVKRHIVSPGVLVARKFNPNHVKRIPDGDLAQIPPGSYIS